MAEESSTLSPTNSVATADNLKKKRKKKSNLKTKDARITKEKCAFIAKVKTSVLARCLWTACRAVVIGFFLILIGAAMATLGFYAKDLSTSSINKGNVTAFVTDESKFMHLDNLTYVGPCIMGIGGVIIVGACVMTFEARDTAGKINPWFKLPSWASSRYTKVELHPPGVQTLCTDVKQLCSPTVELEAAKLRIKADLLQFKDKVKNSVDSVDLTIKMKNGKMQRSSTEPNLAAEANKAKVQQIYSKDYKINLVAKQKIDCSNTLQVNQQKFLRRQAVSVDYNPEFHPVHRSYSNSSTTHNKHRRGDSEDSMVMDLYLPQGSVTLKIHDTSKSVGSASSVQKTRTPSETSQENRRSMSPSPLSFVSSVTQKAPSNCLSPNSEDGLLSVPSPIFKSRMKLEKSQSSDGSNRASILPLPKQKMMVQGKSQSSDDGLLRVPMKKPLEMPVSRGSSISSEDSFRTPSPRPFNMQRFSGGSISSEDGSLGRRHPNISVQSGSYSSQESYTILESPHEDIAPQVDSGDFVVIGMIPPITEKQPVKKFHSVQSPKPYDQRTSDEGQRRAGQYRSKTESAKRHPFLRQSAVDS